MDYKYIEQLLERYFDCETTLQEESILRTFFAQNDVPAHLQQYQSLFEVEMLAADEYLTEDFDERVLKLISEQEAPEAPVVKVKPLHMNYQFRPFFKAAAIVAIVLSFSLSVQMAMYQNQEPTGSSASASTVPLAQEAVGQQEGMVVLNDSLAQISGETPTQDVIPHP